MMDKEVLIAVILRYRGADPYFFIQKSREQGMQALERLLESTVLREKEKLFFDTVRS